MYKTRAEELAWAAGLFEGEGCFTSKTNGRAGSTARYPVCEMRSTDKTTLDRFLRVVRIGKIYGPYPQYGAGAKDSKYAGRVYKPVWTWTAYGPEKVGAILKLLKPGLSKRRRDRAAEILSGS